LSSECAGGRFGRRIAMSELQRVGVSLERQLLGAFDKLIRRQGYQNRSEAIRDLIRQQLSEKRLKDPGARAIAAVFVVYDHHAADLARKLMELQHAYLLKTISSMHIHISVHDCLEVIILRGRVAEIGKMADRIVSFKGVKLGKVNLISIEACSV
jgi:CopG family nickel-responsive transcriptional regulator